jgi:tRNA A-37 threonylcarbamoyl transferase component Bud32
VIEWIELREWGSYLDMFLDDSWSPSAILIEYVADMHQMDLSTFSKSGLASLRAILGEFHEAKVFHGDADPRNMMVVSGKPDGILWIDFDSAQTFPENKPLIQRQQEWMELEILRMDYFVYGLVCSR